MHMLRGANTAITDLNLSCRVLGRLLLWQASLKLGLGQQEASAPRGMQTLSRPRPSADHGTDAPCHATELGNRPLASGALNERHGEFLER